MSAEVAAAHGERETPATRWGQLHQAWRIPQVRRGALGTLLISIGSFTPAYLPQSSPFWPLMRWAHLDNTPAKIVGTLLVLLGVSLLVSAWFRLRPGTGDDGSPEVVGDLLQGSPALHPVTVTGWSGPARRPLSDDRRTPCLTCPYAAHVDRVGGV